MKGVAFLLRLWYDNFPKWWTFILYLLSERCYFSFMRHGVRCRAKLVNSRVLYNTSQFSNVKPEESKKNRIFSIERLIDDRETTKTNPSSPGDFSGISSQYWGR